MSIGGVCSGLTENRLCDPLYFELATDAGNDLLRLMK